MRTKHNYLSLKQHETDAAVKPEVFMSSTHQFMTFEVEGFMDRLMSHTVFITICMPGSNFIQIVTL